MYARGISVDFGPLRQDLVVGLTAAVALLATMVLVSTRFAAYVRSKQIEKELAVARKVQTDFFPTGNPSPMQVDYAARCVPAWEVGGDLYDVFETDDGETALVLGDVSGKGLPAALLMGFVQGAARATSAGRSAGKRRGTAERLNSLLCTKTARERFVTLFWCTFDARTGILRYVNAGHCPPLLVREDGEIRRLEAGGPVLGIVAGARYDYGEVMVEPGDLLVIFSDGIVEAPNANDEEFGEERLISTIQRNRRKSPDDICNCVLANVNEFIGTQMPQDDQTLVIARLESSQLQRISYSEAELAGSAQTAVT
jgi:sigma-B regulation protein RsbU (phosphoserine phosphatase)